LRRSWTQLNHPDLKVGGVGGEFKTIRSGEDGATIACMLSSIPSRMHAYSWEAGLD
jgi:hypothetical protein